MNKCVKCGNEILTGDIHWEMGLCNNCYNELYKDHKTHISLDKMWLKLAQDFRDENEKLQDKVANLEAKLAEKEKEIENLNNRILISQLQAPEEQRLKIIGSSCCQYNPNQDKISFALEQLEKVKDYFIEDYAVCKNFSDFYWNFTEQIDNQIEALTHQHEDKGVQK